ncbi:hypothetical protein IFM89_006476 [Coptis chinensis]|uniref:Endonuclease/exonuclease/phosphatase domain-containing protein n=1 Tax=Coptis chinensis TaxID=261450 RepID=A0A835ILA6_9MAGN|nr:hypothetical protein IFM89_006476 [Coptis chinensis]
MCKRSRQEGKSRRKRSRKQAQAEPSKQGETAWRPKSYEKTVEPQTHNTFENLEIEELQPIEEQELAAEQGDDVNGGTNKDRDATQEVDQEQSAHTPQQQQNAEPVRDNKVVADKAPNRGAENEHISNSAGNSEASLSRIHEVYAEKTLVETEADKVLQMLVRKQHFGEEENEPPDPETPTSRWGDMAEDDIEEEHDPTVGLMGLMVNDTQESDLIYRSRNAPTMAIATNISPSYQVQISISDWAKGIIKGIAEPMISPDDFSKAYLQSLGMSSYFFSNNSLNRVPNIWLFWKTTVDTPNLLCCSNQQITVEVDGVLLSIIHAHCSYVNRRQLWMDLHQFSLMNLPWLILGDFNAYLSYSDKQGGHRPSTKSDVRFRDFYWFQSLDGSSLSLHIYPRHKTKAAEKCFESLEMREIFDNIKFQVEEESKSLELMQKHFDQGNTDEDFNMQMVNQENKVEKLLEQEQMFWRQKTGASWENDNDRSTKFFHAMANTNRSKSLISELKNNEGHTISTQEEIGEFVGGQGESIETGQKQFNLNLVEGVAQVPEELLTKGRSLWKDYVVGFFLEQKLPYPVVRELLRKKMEN